MDAVVSLVVEKKVGAVGRLASALTDLGFTYRRHYVYGSQPDHCCIEVEAEGPESALDKVAETLQDVDGIIDVSAVGEANDGSQGSPGRDLHDDAPEVNEIVWAYPRIFSLVTEYEAKLLPGERLHRLTKLGAQVGRRLGMGSASLAGAQSVEAALRGAVLPALKSIAVGDVHQSDLRIADSIFVRQNLDMMFLSKEEPRGCCLLTGLIQGMLGEGVHLPRVWVTETKCRESGDPVCYFKVDEIRAA